MDSPYRRTTVEHEINLAIGFKNFADQVRRPRRPRIIAISRRVAVVGLLESFPSFRRYARIIIAGKLTAGQCDWNRHNWNFSGPGSRGAQLVTENSNEQQEFTTIFHAHMPESLLLTKRRYFPPFDPKRTFKSVFNDGRSILDAIAHMVDRPGMRSGSYCAQASEAVSTCMFPAGAADAFPRKPFFEYARKETRIFRASSSRALAKAYRIVRAD